MDVPNRITQFCQNAPAPAVIRAKVRSKDVEVERLYGSVVPTDKLAKHFADNAEDETLLVSVGKDGNVLGTSWPVFREQVSLELGIPDMKEQEAASLLLSTKCKEDLRAFRDKGLRPASVEPTATGGCAHCSMTPSTPDFATALTLLFVVLLRPRRRSARGNA